MGSQGTFSSHDKLWPYIWILELEEFNPHLIDIVTKSERDTGTCLIFHSTLVKSFK